MKPVAFERLGQLAAPLFGSTDRLNLLRTAAHILVIDNEQANLELIRGVLNQAGYRCVATLRDARQLETRLQTAHPDLVILDLNMPRRDGFDVLEALHPWIVAEHLPVLVASGHMSHEARHRALSLGARDFLTKPFNSTELTLRVRNQLETRLLYQDVRTQNRALLEAVNGRTQQLEETRIEMLERLVMAAEYRDDNTSRHTERVGHMSAELATAIGVAADDVRLIGRASALHDVGKIGIPDALLLKPSKLTDGEMAVMRTHTTIGATILSGSKAPLLRLAEVIAASHHERWDGEGYPQKLAGADIPLVGRIVAVADAFDALTNDRPYRRARPVGDGIREIIAHRGTQFDATVVDALQRILPSLGYLATH